MRSVAACILLRSVAACILHKHMCTCVSMCIATHVRGWTANARIDTDLGCRITRVKPL